ncbi:ATP-binding cassette domain-containing protein [Lactobacillus gasseri]|nr:ATP-binding cassette domain-containing protein [Lactobacillus gasseri]MCZ4003719.1 ATP-binding cassette domain-containing protein [Lactobacillus gasseri]MCZ4004061.1 ATP-binding cassette domain-containing protein [Lactobacillus gasseri]MCZ4006015.1 ATP-binding cassette domain-containing protein [Lactobacillus gasseri]MCZ4011057.1 ATP-binding cassette domain-containing protein [Lactobacillus gasseri]
MIEYKNISKKYQDQTILKDVSFTVKKGDIFVLVGPSGSGKTTLLKMFNRLIEPTKGEILLDDKSIKEYDLRKLREKTGYVLQTASLFPNLTVGENITIVLEQEGVSRTERRKRQKELLKSVDLDPKLYCDRMPNELSGGE